MFLRKVILLIAVFILSFSIITAQSFSYSGPTSRTISYGQTTTSFTYSFSYQNLSGLLYPSLSISVDGSVVLGPRFCTTDSFLPSSYTLNLEQGSHTITFKLSKLVDDGTLCGARVEIQTNEFTVTSYFQVEISNNFGGGIIGVDGAAPNSGFHKTTVEGSSISLSAIEQDYNSYHYIWNTNGTNNSNWVSSALGSGPFASSQSTTYSVQSTDINASIVANMRSICNLEFISVGGTVYVNGSHPSPYTAEVVEQNSVYATGGWYSSNGIEYNFDHWVKDGQSFSSTITPSAHGSYNAVYVGKPTNTSEYAGASYADVGDPIVVTWVDNPNTAVNQFQIWRKVKHDGVTGSPVLLTTVGRGVQTYTDYEYAGTDGYTDDLLWYDVRAYYSTDGTYSDADYQAAFGAPSASTLENNLVATLSNEIPAEYSISNYPNPFNPTTTINYQLPQDGFVTIKVYDMLGKEIATLVDGSRTAGYHNVNFDASRLTSGIYIYTINANNYVQSKKMILMK